MMSLCNSVCFAGMHEDQAEIGGQRSIVGVDAIEGKIIIRGQFDHFRAHGFEFVRQHSVL